MKKQMKAGTASSDAKTLPIGEGQIQDLAQRFLAVLRESGSGEEQLQFLAQLQYSALIAPLADDNHKKAFWINCYNAFNLYWQRRESISSLRAKRRHFFAKRQIVAGIRLSLNEIEHGILRRSKLWWAKGWLRNPFPRARERALRLDREDPRIHFALNCGANGCPAIRFYTLEGIEAELELATQAFFATELRMQEGNRKPVIMASSLFKMYIGDFGGRVGLRNWIQRYRPDLAAHFPIRFLPYDWTPNLEKFED